ncbi:hypothetical protein GCM10017620_25890 [Brevundimonas intermedia]|uniref:Phage tail protein n=1 Tax=Brevundimonas intermedia TaxID=74315 RepID=A0ABQ5TCZ2_9CAUL|nr:phage tail protein [Brevundimonas intermedia]GLK49616.1 hypothetical protein GCM10017620_25890 [Brevundimonas intermedia]
MKKPESLLAALVAALEAKHHIKGDSSRLQMVMSNVRPEVSGRPGTGFQLAYTVEIHMPDFNGSPLEVVVPMLRWIERWQHDLVASADKAAKAIDMTFVRLDDRRYDLHAAVDLTEVFRYEGRPDGGQDLVVVDEPMPMALETGDPLHAVYLDDELIMHCSAHPEAAIEP